MKEIVDSAYSTFFRKFGEWCGDRAEQIVGGEDKELSQLATVIDDKRRSWYDSIALTKSPIEQILVSGMMFLTDGYNEIYATNGLIPDYINHWGTYFIPQYRIGSYTADFAIICQHNDKMKMIAVECDGHDFHEKTKAQAGHDKKRDRYFTAQGFKILRFTGSEIYQKVDECIDEIQFLVEKTMEELLVEAEIVQPRRLVAL